jgi:hypothetical protein
MIPPAQQNTMTPERQNDGRELGSAAIASKDPD